MADELLPSRDFHEFLQALQIDSKEAGLRSLGECLLGSQQMLLDEIRKGIDEGVHEFVTLKSRQLGVSTMSLAIDLYNAYSHPAIGGALVTHDESTRNQFRTTLALYRSGLAEEWQREVVDDNRDQLVFDNGSRLRFLVAGTRSRSTGSSKLGRSGALIQCHSTEVAFWGDPSGVDALRASFAQTNPLRFFHWESTANGENWFYDMWRDAQKAKSIRAIFVSWWANDYYGLPRDGRLYGHYWGVNGRMTKPEAAITREVNARYGWEINDCQWAWYRWMASEKITDASLMQQEYPHREEDAFISTGSAFFKSMNLADARRVVKARRKLAKYYRMDFGHDFTDTTVTECKEAVSNLIVWAPPAVDGWYVLGVDPAFASSPDSADSVVSVWRCWYNRLEQVAEFTDNKISTHAVAWCFAYLGGYYGRSRVNLEITGPGGAVLQEYQNLRSAAFSGRLPASGEMRQVVASIRQYFYRRPDQTSGPTSFLHTKTGSAEVSERIYNAFRDYFERQILVCSSDTLITQMGSVRRNETGSVGAPTGKNDDKVMAAALAVMCWNDDLRTQLLAQGIMWKEQEEKEPGPANLVGSLVSRYFAKIGIVPPDSPPPPKKRVYVGTSRRQLAKRPHQR